MAVPDQQLPKSGCFSRFLRLFLCAHSNNAPPIHPEEPSSHSQTLSSHPNKPPMPDTITTPGVVARLMGLDSLPNITRLSKRVAPDSVPRSKSVNFLDYLLQLDPNHQEANHRRIRTSSSFREVPAPSSSFQQQKNHDLVVFLWDDDTGSKSKSTTRKPEVGFGEWRQRKEEKEKKKKKKISKLKNEPRRVRVSARPSTGNYDGYRNSGGSNSWSSRSRMRKEAFVEPKFRKRALRKQKSLKKLQNECCSENLSPVSVLDVDETRLLGSKSKRKSSAQRCLDEDVEGRGLGSSNIKGNAYTEVNSETEYCSELMAKLLNSTENDIRESDWRLKSMFESDTFEEISFMFEHKIFDFLLREVVDELVQL